MKRLIFLLLLLPFLGYSQTVVTVSTADTSYFRRTTGTTNAEVRIRNGDRNIVNGIAYNASLGWLRYATVGNGLTFGSNTFRVDSSVFANKTWVNGRLLSYASATSPITLSAIGSSPNANGATLTGAALNLQPASVSFGGVMTTGAQAVTGVKTWNRSQVLTGLAKYYFTGSTPDTTTAAYIYSSNSPGGATYFGNNGVDKILITGSASTSPSSDNIYPLVDLNYDLGQAHKRYDSLFVRTATATTFIGSLVGNASTATNVAVGGITGLGTGVATALAINVGSAGAPVLFNGALGTPSSGTVTNLTGTASININGTVGATTPTTATFTNIGLGTATATSFTSSQGSGAPVGAPFGLSNNTSVAWRNAANDGNVEFYLNGSDAWVMGGLGTGDVQSTAGVISVTSDSKAKDVRGGFIGSALTAIGKISPGKYWNYKTLGVAANSVSQFGLLAEDVHAALGEEFAPTQRKYNRDGSSTVTLIEGEPVYGLSGNALLSLTIQALQEANKKIELLNQRILTLESK